MSLKERFERRFSWAKCPFFSSGGLCDEALLLSIVSLEEKGQQEER